MHISTEEHLGSSSAEAHDELGKVHSRDTPANVIGATAKMDIAANGLPVLQSM